MNRVAYYLRVELTTQHDVVLAEDSPAESFLDMKDGSNYANRPGPGRLYPDFSAPHVGGVPAAAPLIVTWAGASGGT